MSCGYFSRMRVERRTPGEIGAEGDVEMMLAGEPFTGRIPQNLAHHPLEGVLYEEIVADQVLRHGCVRRSAGSCWARVMLTHLDAICGTKAP